MQNTNLFSREQSRKLQTHCTGGGFLARDWGSGATDQLHRVSYRLHEELAAALAVTSYRKLPVLQVGQRKLYRVGPNCGTTLGV